MREKISLWSDYPPKNLSTITEEEFRKNYLCQPIDLSPCPKCKGRPRKTCEICKGESWRNSNDPSR